MTWFCINLALAAALELVAFRRARSRNGRLVVSWPVGFVFNLAGLYLIEAGLGVFGYF